MGWKRWMGWMRWHKKECLQYNVFLNDRAYMFNCNLIWTQSVKSTSLYNTSISSHTICNGFEYACSLKKKKNAFKYAYLTSVTDKKKLNFRLIPKFEAFWNIHESQTSKLIEAKNNTDLSWNFTLKKNPFFSRAIFTKIAGFHICLGNKIVRNVLTDKGVPTA